MSANPRLLFLCQTLPYPPDGGVQIRTYNVLRLLARSFDVTALCFYRWKGGAVQRDLDASVEALNRIARVEAFPIPQEHSRVRYVWDHVRSLITGRVYTRFAYESREFEERLAELVEEERFDLIHLDSLDVSGYARLLPGVPIVCVHHNVESDLLRRRAEAERSWWRQAYIRKQAALTEKLEREWPARVDLNIAVSEKDTSTLSHRAPGARVIVVPNGVDVEYFQPAEGADEGIVFVGGTTWFPNRDALAYFGEEILPRIRSAGVWAPVRWVGRAASHERDTASRRHGIELTGYVRDVRPYVRDAACFVVPLRVGGGTRLKILDAWAMGKAVVSTSIGCEGLDARDGENILVRDTPESFARAVARVMNDEELRRRLGRAGRRTVERTYSWDVIRRPMIDAYRELLDEGASASAKVERPRGAGLSS